MSEALPDDYLQLAIYDAMRGVRLATLKRALAEDERRVLADAVFAAIKRAGWQVSYSPDYGARIRRSGVVGLRPSGAPRVGGL